MGSSTKSNGMRTLENSSSSEEEDRIDLLGRKFQVPRPKSRSNASIAVSISNDLLRTQTVSPCRAVELIQIVFLSSPSHTHTLCCVPPQSDFVYLKNQSGIYYDVDYEPSAGDLFDTTTNSTNAAGQNSSGVPGPHGIPMSTYTSGRAPSSYYMK